MGLCDFVLVAVTLLLDDRAASSAASCTCRLAIETNDWCEVHAVGYVGSVPIRSRWLFDALDAHGHDVDLTTFECPTCRRAAETDGYCTEHRVGFVDGQAYFSMLTHLLAKGRLRRVSEITCPTCRKNGAGHGWCDACGVGMVGAVEIGSRRDFDRLAEAIRVLRLANEAAERCERCAVAIVTDTRCAVCGITYRGGTPSAPPSGPPAEPERN